VRRRKVTYPPPKTATSGGTRPSPADARAAAAAARVANINLDAMTGRADVRQGSRVQIASGLYAGEIAIVESVVGGVIPAAVVRTEAGRTRRVRTVDLIPTTAESKADAAASAPTPTSPPGDAPSEGPAST
jgi:hypothetical protein